MAMSACSGSVAEMRVQFTLDCKTQRCKGEATVESQNLRGSVFMTPDFHFLFPSPSENADSPERSYLVDGDVDLTITRKYVFSAQAIQNRNACYAEARQKLLKLSAGTPSEFVRISKQNGNIAEVKPGILQLEFGKITVSYPTRKDVRQDAFIGVEFVPSQRFTIDTRTPTDDQIRSIISPAKKTARLASRHTNLAATMDERTDIQRPKNEPEQWHLRLSVKEGVVSGSADVSQPLRLATNAVQSMKIVVEGDTNTTISPLTSPEQKLVSLVPATWLWKVNFGENHDKSALQIKLVDKTVPASESIVAVYQAEITLTKPWDFQIRRFFSNYWQWIIVTFLLPYIVEPALKKVRRKRGDGDEDK